MKKVQALLLGIIISVTFVLVRVPAGENNTTNEYGLTEDIQDGVILHCFNWKYTDIIKELPDIAKAGFTSVQTSPAQAGAGCGTWYWLYQPLGFSVGTNELGTKAELQKLCEEAEKYGIKVIVDVVANHLAGSHDNIDPELKDSQYWHNNGSVNDWWDRWRVRNCDIGMQDINSENVFVQQKVKSYLEELKSIGVDGIRWDAAKHISLPSEGCGFWITVTENLGLYHYGEILGGPYDGNKDNDSYLRSLMDEYTSYMSVTDSEYGRWLRDGFAAGYVPSTYANWERYDGIDADELVYWAESHDTYSNGYEDGYSFEMSQNVIDRAYAIAASRNGASALYFSRPSSTDKESIKIGVKGSLNFKCKEVAAVNHLHNALAGQKEWFVTDMESNVCGVCREKGAVIVLGSGGNRYVEIENGGGTTAPGTYKDEITGNTWTVTDKLIKGTVGSSGIAVFYKDERTVVSGGETVPSGTEAVTTEAATEEMTAESISHETVIGEKVTENSTSGASVETEPVTAENTEAENETDTSEADITKESSVNSTEEESVEETVPESTAETTVKKGKSCKTAIIAVLIVSVLAAGVTAGFLILRKKKNKA